MKGKNVPLPWRFAEDMLADSPNNCALTAGDEKITCYRLARDAMATSAKFLHLTDTHLSSAGVTFARDDHKVAVGGIKHDTREDALELTLKRLAERLLQSADHLDGVWFTGDAQHRGEPGGHRILLDLVLQYFKPLGVTANNIVAVPGNHDVPRSSAPSSTVRYQDFTSVWRTAGCVTPWLDGVDVSASDGGSHKLTSVDGLWAVFPINTCNWSHATQTLPEPLAGVWAELSVLASRGDTRKEAALREQLDDLARFDMARISSSQLEVLRGLVENSTSPSSGRQLRIALLHHHLRVPSLREELKPFADISNLEQVRRFLRDRGITVVVHGHKHQFAAQFEHVYDQTGSHDHRALIVSGGTFHPEGDSDAARLITFTGMPHNPTVSIESIGIERGGVERQSAALITRRIWSTPIVSGAPVVIQGTDLDEVYDRACEVAGSEAIHGMLIVHLDLPANSSRCLPLPSKYPLPNSIKGDEREEWFQELVAWWQLDRSGLEHRMPFVHGARLRRFGGKINQIDRVKKLLGTKASTRALAILVDPFRDFTEDGVGEEFASFCLIEFKRRDPGGARSVIDVIAFYRAQEFARWWPVNVAELRYLQWEICDALNFCPGRITTFAADARTHSRSPTQVAMPVIDRWIDQAPERLYTLANVLTQGMSSTKASSNAIMGWERTLADLEATAQEYHPDGLPIAIEGLRLLAAYLDSSQEGQSPDLKSFVRVLWRLADSNETFERSDRTRSDFDRWAPSTLDTILELRELTQDLLRPETEGDVT